MKKLLILMANFLIIVFCTSCGSEKLTIEYNTPVKLNFASGNSMVKYATAINSYESHDYSGELPETDESQTERFNCILDEMNCYFEEMYEISVETIDTIPVVVVNTDKLIEILAYTEENAEKIEAVYNSYYKTVFVNMAALEQSEEKLTGIYAHEAVHAWFQMYNDTETSVFYKNNKDGALGYYFSEGYAQKISCDFLEVKYPDAKDVRTDAYGLCGFVPKIMAYSVENADKYYLTNDIENMEKEINYLVWQNTDSFKTKDKYTPFEHLIYEMDFSEYVKINATNSAYDSEAAKAELAIWEITYVMCRDIGSDNQNKCLKVFEDYDTKCCGGIFKDSGFLTYLDKVMRNI